VFEDHVLALMCFKHEIALLKCHCFNN